MELETIPNLTTAQSEADQFGLSLTEQSAYLRDHADVLKNAATKDFSSPDLYKQEAQTIENINNDLALKQRAIAEKELHHVLDNHYGDDVAAKNRFISEMNRNNGDTSEWSPEMRSIESDLNEALAPISSPNKGIASKGALVDANGFAIADFSVRSDTKYHPVSAFVSFNGQRYDNSSPEEIKADPAGHASPFRNMLSAVSGDPKTLYSKGGDTILFPKNFDPVDYTLTKLHETYDQTKEDLAQNQAIQAARQTDYEEGNKVGQGSGGNLSMKIQSQSQLLNQLEDQIQKTTEAKNHAIGTNVYNNAWINGVNEFVKDRIKEKVATNNPRYANVGEGIGESIMQDVENFLPRTANTLAGMAMAVEDLFSGTAPTPYDEQVRQDIDAANKSMGVGSFSRPELNNPETAEVARGLSQTAQSLAQSMVGGGISEVGGLAVMAASAGGQKYNDLVNLENDLREQGNTAAADNVREKRALISVFNAGTEWLSELAFDSHNVVRKSLGKGTFGGVVKAAGGEGLEEGIAGYPEALADYVAGITNDEQFAQALSQVPTQMAYGAVAGAVAGGIHETITNVRYNQALQVINDAKNLAATTGTTISQALEDAAKARVEKEKQDKQDLEDKVKPEIGDSATLDGKHVPDPESIKAVTTSVDDINNDIDRQLTDEKNVTKAQEDLLTPSSTIESQKPTALDTVLQAKPEDAVKPTTPVAGLEEAAPAVKPTSVTETAAESTAATVPAVTPEPTPEPTPAPAAVTLNPTVEPVAENPVPAVIPPAQAITESPSYVRAFNRSKALVFQIFKDNLKWLKEMEAKYGKNFVQEVAYFATAQQESVLMDDSDTFHLVVDQLPTEASDVTTRYYEHEFALEVNRKILHSPRYQAANEQERQRIRENEFIKEQSIPIFRSLPEVMMSTKYGKFSLETVDSVRAKVDNGEIDPSTHLFYHHTNDNKKETELAEIVGQDRIVGGDLGSVGIRTDEKGFTRQNKFDEQAFLAGSEFQIPSHSVTDLLKPDEIKTTTREAYNESGDDMGQYEALTDEAKAKLFAVLDERYPEGWVGKKVGGMAGKGMIRSWVPRTRDTAVTTVPGNDYIFQKGVHIDKEYRLSVFVGEDGKAVPIPGGFQVKQSDSGWFMHGRVLVPGEQFKDVKKVIDFLNQKGFGEGTNTTYGIDVFKLKDGSLKITELNATDSYGMAGSVAMYAGAQRGLEAIARDKHSMEALLARAAVMHHMGDEPTALRLVAEAIREGGGTIPDAVALRERGKMFYGDDGGWTVQVPIAQLRSIPIPIIDSADSAVGHIKFTVRDFLNHIIAANISVSKAAQRMLDVATKAKNPGLDAVVAKTRNNTVPFFYRRYHGSKGKLILSNHYLTPGTVMHEIGHALTDQAIPSELSVYNYKNITGKQYLGKLTDYIKKGKNNVLKQAILDYITTVEGLGLTDTIFGNERIIAGDNSRKGSARGYYSLSSLDEFIAELYSGVRLKDLMASFNHDQAKESILKRFISKMVDFVKTHLFGNSTAHAEFFDNAFENALLLANYNEITESEWDKQLLSTERYSNNFELTNLRKEADKLANRTDLHKIDLQYLSKLNKRIAELAPGQSNMMIRSSDGLVLDKTHPNFKIHKKLSSGEDSSVTETSENDVPINPPKYSNPQPTGTQINGYNIDQRYLRRDQRAELRLALSNPKLPSTELDKILKRLDKSAQKAEYRVLKKMYREPFKMVVKDGKYVPGKYEYTGIRDAKIHLVDWLIQNPEDKGGIPASLRAKNRVQQARTMRYLKDKITAGIGGAYTKFADLDPAVQKIVHDVMDHINNNVNAANMTNRQMMAINVGMKMFHESDGEDIRGFASLYEKITIADRVVGLNAEKERLRAAGVRRIFGDAISDWRRMEKKASKTRTGVADKATEADAIFNRKGTFHEWAKFMAKTIEAINLFKYNDKITQDKYLKQITALGATTRLEDMRISCAKLAIQYEINPDKPIVPQLKAAISQLETSINRKERSTNKRDNRDGLIERTAFEQLIRPVIDGIASGTLVDENDIIDAIENGLTPKELQLLNIAKQPGKDYWKQLNSIHQITRGEQVDQIHNFIHRSQYSLNPESDVNHWSRRPTEATDPILKPREGLGNEKSAAVFNMDWRADLAEHLKQAMYELHTGTERVFTHRTVDSPAFAKILDDADSNRLRSKRMLAQYGGIFANLKNKEIQWGNMGKAVVSLLQFTNWWKLVSAKGGLNQMIPTAVMLGQYPQAMVVAGVHRIPILGHKGRAITNKFLKENHPDLDARLSHFDQTTETLRSSSRQYKQSGLPGISAGQQIFEKMMETASRFGRFSAKKAGLALRLPVILTNGLTESFSAKSAFFAIYSQKLKDKGIINNLEDIFTHIPYDATSMSEATMEVEKFLLAPISPEMRGDFWQKNAVGKELARGTLFALARTQIQQTIRAGTAWRDLVRSISDYSKYGSPEDLAQVVHSFQNAMVQNLQLAAYQAINLLNLKLASSVASTGFFLAAAIMNGEDKDKDRWMRRMRILEKMNMSNAGRFMMSQGAIDFALQIIPVSPALTSNVGRGVAADILKHLYDIVQGGNVHEMKQQLETTREEIGFYDKVFDAAYYLASPSMYAKGSEAREVLEYQAEILKAQIKARENWIAATGDDLAKNMMPFGNYVQSHTRDFPEMEAQAAQLLKGVAPDSLYNFLMGDDATRIMKYDKIGEGRDNAWYWWLSYMLHVASPIRSAASTVVTERATKETSDFESQAKADAENLKYLVPAQ